MFNKKNLVAIVTALSIGAGTFIATAPAHAASSLNFTTLENSVESGVTEVGRKGKRHNFSNKSKKRKRQLRGTLILGPTNAPMARAMLPYK